MLLVQIQVKTTASTEEGMTDKGNENFSKATILFCG
jgi:hypothetical protein